MTTKNACGILGVHLEFFFYRLEDCFSARSSTVYCQNRYEWYYSACVLLSFLLSSHELPFAAGWGGDSDLG